MHSEDWNEKKCQEFHSIAKLLNSLSLIAASVLASGRFVVLVGFVPIEAYSRINL